MDYVAVLEARSLTSRHRRRHVPIQALGESRSRLPSSLPAVSALGESRSRLPSSLPAVSALGESPSRLPSSLPAVSALGESRSLLPSSLPAVSALGESHSRLPSSLPAVSSSLWCSWACRSIASVSDCLHRVLSFCVSNFMQYSFLCVGVQISVFL